MLNNQMNEQMIYEIVDNVSAKETYQEMYCEVFEIEPTYQQMKNDKDRNETTFNDCCECCHTAASVFDS
jgi:hypothetical protein